MSSPSRAILPSFAATLLIAFAIGPGSAAAQEDGAAPAGPIEEVTVVGSRRRDRSASESPVPVDVVTGDEFLAHGDSDMDSLIAAMVPSYNVAQEPISDAATLIRPATLRSLPPDATLVLVNGKRRHRAAVIALLGSGISGGSQGPDLSVIPAIALDRLEVLRDGASAQYGSDAIAGIMNFVLKEDSEGAIFDAKWGSHFEGDGDSMTLAANAGFRLTDAGFANLSFEWKEADPTSRSAQRGDAQDLIDAGNTDVRQPAAQIWGAPEISGDVKMFGNFGIDLGNGSEAYAFGNYAKRQVEGGFYFRNPHTRGGVFDGPKIGGRETVKVADFSGNTAAAIDSNLAAATASGRLGADDFDYDDEVLVPAITSVAATGGCPIVFINDDVADPAALAEIAGRDDCYSLISRFPGGFTPQFGGFIDDLSLAGGIRGELDSGWFYDVSAVAGTSEAAFYIYNTINPQLFTQRDAIDTYFHAGTYVETDRVFNFDMSRQIDTGGYAPVNVAWGLEYRDETFEIRNGEPNSFFIDPNLATQGFGIGSNGFPGFQPGDAGSNTVTAYGAYIDVEADVSERWLLGGALRWEDYNEFGSTLDGKVAARVQLGDSVALRGALSTGFRVPTAGQANLRNVTTEFNQGRLADIATLPPTHPIARQLGAEPLTPEESVNTTLGLVFDAGAADVTIDYYNIEIEDRIAFTSRFNLTPADIQALLAAGVSDAQSFTAARYFTNQQTVEASGIDVVVTAPFALGSGESQLTFVANWSDIELKQFNPAFTDAVLQRQIEEGRPDTRFAATWSHAQGSWRVMGRARYYGEYYDAPTGSGPNSFVPGTSLVFDLEAAFDVNDSLSILVGLQNAFDEYPSTNPNGEVAGLIYPEQSPFGFNGGYYYLRANWRL